MSEALIAGITAGYGIAVPVGAIALLIVGTGMRCGFACAVSAGAGAATADLAYALVAWIGGAAVADRLQPWSDPIRLLSASVLVGIAGWGLWRAGARDEAIVPPRREFAATYGRYLALTVVNPLTVVYFTALVLGSGAARAAGVWSALAFGAGAFAASLSWQTLLAAVGAFGRRGLTATARRAGSVAGNVVILLLALRLALDR